MTAKTNIYIACEKCGIEVEKGCSRRRMCSTCYGQQHRKHNAAWRLENARLRNRKCSFDGCGRTAMGKGDLCMAHYQQRRRGIELRPIRPKKRTSRPILEKAEDILATCSRNSDGCLIPSGEVGSRSGTQDRLCMSHEGRTMQLAKIIWIAQKGDIPLYKDGRELYVCHKNDCNKDCVNIDHLELGAPSQNSKDYYVGKPMS